MGRLQAGKWPQLEGDLEGCVIVAEDSCRIVLAGMEAYLQAIRDRGGQNCELLEWAAVDLRFFLGMGKAFKAAREEGYRQQHRAERGGRG